MASPLSCFISALLSAIISPLNCLHPTLAPSSVSPELTQEEVKYGLYLHVGIRRRMPALGITHCEAVGKSPALSKFHSADQDVEGQLILQDLGPMPHTQDRDSSQN